MQTPLLSVILPAYREASRIGASVQRLSAFLSGQGWAAEIIVVDDGSPDDTARVAKATAAQVTVPVHVISYAPNRGKGYAVRTGWAASRGARVGFMDADLAVALHHLGEVLCLLEGKAEVVVGSKWQAGAACLGSCPPARRFMSRAVRWASRLVLGLRATDTQCGFKFMRGDLARQMARVMRADGFGLDLEILYLARKWGCRVVEIPVQWHNLYAGSSVRAVRDGLDVGLEMLRILWRELRGQYPSAPVPDD
jgi:dolichyl-phosphate beta-glucosyltransferase